MAKNTAASKDVADKLNSEYYNFDKISERIEHNRSYEKRFRALLCDAHSSIIERCKKTTIVPSTNNRLQTLVIGLSDLHFGKGGDFSMDIAKQMVNSITMEALNTLSPSFDEIVISLVGDLVEGDGNIFNSQAFVMEDRIMNQVNQCKASLMEMITTLAKNHPDKKIRIYGVPGNHGEKRGGGLSDPMNNYDTAIYMGLEDMITLLKSLNVIKDVSIDYPKDNVCFINFKVKGWNFTAKHEFARNIMAPSGASKIMAEHINNKTNLILTGHHHTSAYTTVGPVHYIRIGCLPGADEYALNLGLLVDEPRQVMFVTTSESIVDNYRTPSLAKIKESHNETTRRRQCIQNVGLKPTKPAKTTPSGPYEPRRNKSGKLR